MKVHENSRVSRLVLVILGRHIEPIETINKNVCKKLPISAPMCCTGVGSFWKWWNLEKIFSSNFMEMFFKKSLRDCERNIHKQFQPNQIIKVIVRNIICYQFRENRIYCKITSDNPIRLKSILIGLRWRVKFEVLSFKF